MKPYTMTRAEVDGVVEFTFTSDRREGSLILRPDDYQSGAAMRRVVMAWIADT